MDLQAKYFFGLYLPSHATIHSTYTHVFLNECEGSRTFLDSSPAPCSDQNDIIKEYEPAAAYTICHHPRFYCPGIYPQ